VNLLEPGEVFGDRVNAFDLRVAKILRVGRTRTNVGVDIYNMFNASAVLTYNQAFNRGGRWLVPTTVMAARFAKLGASIDPDRRPSRSFSRKRVRPCGIRIPIVRRQ